MNNLILDTNEVNILSLTPDKEVYLETNGETRKYKAVYDEDSGWDFIAVDDDNIIYDDFGCSNFKELRAMLLVDYAEGILTKVYF